MKKPVGLDSNRNQLSWTGWTQPHPESFQGKPTDKPLNWPSRSTIITMDVGASRDCCRGSLGASCWWWRWVVVADPSNGVFHIHMASYGHGSKWSIASFSYSQPPWIVKPTAVVLCGCSFASFCLGLAIVNHEGLTQLDKAISNCGDISMVCWLRSRFHTGDGCIFVGYICWFLSTAIYLLVCKPKSANEWYQSFSTNSDFLAISVPKSNISSTAAGKPYHFGYHQNLD